MVRPSIITVSLAAACSLVLGSCAVAPRPGDKPVTVARAAPATGVLAESAKRTARKRAPGESSFLLLEGNKEALDWRLALIDEARSSIDIQLYLWHSGSSSRVLMDRVIRAADRGVRVRILVDDFLFVSNEKTVAALCRYHPNIDIRIFNPTRLRGNPLGSAAEFILNFQHLNRRMHNKTWTVDRTFTIVGGRNVGDQYYGLDENYNFIDLDVLACGPVVKDVSDGFDLFWNSAQAYPGALLSSRAKPGHVADLREELREGLAAERTGRLRLFSTAPRDWSRELAALPGQMVHGQARFLQDHPDPEKDERDVIGGLRHLTRDDDGEIVLVSPYLIPSKGAIDNLGESVDSGVEVGILAPSLSANNQPAAHGKYKKKRKPILRAGARLFEMRADGSDDLRALADVDPVRSKEICMHMKLIVGDRERCFIGSLNLDPRAMVINTESGMLIDSPELSEELLALVRRIALEDSWEVTLDERGRFVWTSGAESRSSQPPARFSKKFVSFLVGWLPIESQL